MNHQPLISALAEILRAAPAELTRDYKLDSGNWDSVAVMATIGLIDEHYGITVPTDRLVACTSIAQLLALLDEQKSGHS